MVKDDLNDETGPPPEETTEDPEAIVTEAETSQQYDFHIVLHGENIDRKLKDAATVAFRLGLITKPNMPQLMSLFIGWGLAILKKQWLERVGYN